MIRSRHATQKKKLVCRIACACFVLHFLSFSNAALAGNTATFLVDAEYDKSGRSQIEASLKYTSPNAYFYVEQEYYNKLSSTQKTIIDSRIIEIAHNFDQIIYPTVRNTFGEEWDPGIDNDHHITILLTEIDYNVGGYFNPNDEYAKDLVAEGRSNEKEMLYINPNFINDPRLEGFVAHELQHMITWNQKTREGGTIDDIWTNESRSELASSLIENSLGVNFLESNLYTRKSIFLNNYSDSLTDWNNQNYDYGTVSMFVQYLKDQLGLGIFKDITSGPESGIKSIDSALKENHKAGFRDIFTDWTIANYVNNQNINSLYGYQNKDLSGKIIKPEIIKLAESESKVFIDTDIKNWSDNCYEINLEQKKRKKLLYRYKF